MVDRSFDCEYSIEEIRGLIKSLCPGRRWISPNGESFRILEKEVRRDYPPYDSDPDRACFVVDSSEECGHAIIEIFRRPGGVRLQLRGGGEGFNEFVELLIREARGPGEAGKIEQRNGERPWERIRDVSYHRHLVELWWDGYSSSEIGKQLGYAPKTILNRLSDLRKIYGEGIVPKRHKRDKRGK